MLFMHQLLNLCVLVHHWSTKLNITFSTLKRRSVFISPMHCCIISSSLPCQPLITPYCNHPWFSCWNRMQLCHAVEKTANFSVELQHVGGILMKMIYQQWEHFKEGIILILNLNTNTYILSLYSCFVNYYNFPTDCHLRWHQFKNWNSKTKTTWSKVLKKKLCLTSNRYNNIFDPQGAQIISQVNSVHSD